MRLPALILLTICILMATGCSEDETKVSYIVCESTYALCTTAKCTSIEEGQETVLCDCEVKTGYSVGSTPCHEPIETPEGKQVVSRYFPIKSFAFCTNERPWAWCYDRPCIVDKSDPTRAACACNIVENDGPYVMVTDSYTDATCTTGFYSSARVKDLKRVTEFLKTNADLKSFALKQVNK
ncbi:MAG: hypothetical protein KDJ72_06030 [Methyloceanibacter sp.]|uniref:hypothetical protein n=1 Tax=Methyloceanibacter sp. TaxID=1965321 RepID=UPI001D31C9A0|nr:hypothetical protein [Methyloceanibacter sp.]MCB1442564.1 hypothetical protein [Methyloceanibacter sp.]MCC0059473.1 hypothetical protein [Hyphomicrobiaceae bacterium]